MSNPGLCCNECFKLIAKQNTIAARLWLDLCELQSMSAGAFGLRVEDFPSLRLLEVMRFLVTTDHEDVLLMRMQGLRHDGSGVYFCGGACEE